ncbi:uncharacterized protein EAE98_004527 [Botrytis deweyae]|uniref:Endoplasmic reticulum transmembrane protein n=1 Tax=Botrytis deweyae TaxID=2478750 RepID=A0ABQ7IR93_9HELO|nr:uncharacterized protein EAE98_004527 [Botrytis deweyae]KAF7931791.1 hypothetical protein EAE98_004527 [Botrytis deweyae]
MVSVFSIPGVSEAVPVQYYFNYILPSNSSSLLNSTTSDERQKSDEILYNKRQYLRWMMILYTLRFLLSAIRLCFLIRKNRKERMKQDAAAAIRDLQEKMESGLTENGSLGSHLETIERVAWEDGEKEFS